MSWAAYKEVVLDLLPLQFGLHELRILMTLNREQKESPQSWVQRLETGKRLLEEKNIKLPDQLYVQIALDYLTSKEKEQVADQVGTAATGATHQTKIAAQAVGRTDGRDGFFGRPRAWNELRVPALLPSSDPPTNGLYGSASKALFRAWRQGQNNGPEERQKRSAGGQLQTPVREIRNSRSARQESGSSH